jgi:hypothetical protein
VYDKSKITNPAFDFKTDEKGNLMVLNAITTGIAKENVSEDLKGWKDYNATLNQLKK